MTRHDPCREARELLAAFYDDELPCDVSHRIQEHLDACPPCGRLGRFEERFTRSVMSRCRRIEAPESFFRQMAEKLKDPERLLDPAPGSGAAGGVPARAHPPRRRWVLLSGLAAGAALLVAAPGAVAWLASRGLFGSREATAARVSHLQGVLVCLECEKAGAPLQAQKACHKEGHRTGLRCPRTGLWSFVANDTSSPLIADPGRRGTRIEVEGRVLDDIHSVDVRHFTILPGT